MPPDEKGRPGGTTPRNGRHVQTTSTPSVDDTPTPWETIRAGWSRAGDAMPRPGSLAWRALPADDPVKAAAVSAADLGTERDLRRHGPAVAQALHELPEVPA